LIATLEGKILNDNNVFSHILQHSLPAGFLVDIPPITMIRDQGFLFIAALAVCELLAILDLNAFMRFPSLNLMVAVCGKNEF
jgi:uncharacterized oligopeptide transporter (OPT) family protein